jgi:hypothetical protein
LPDQDHILVVCRFSSGRNDAVTVITYCTVSLQREMPPRHARSAFQSTHAMDTAKPYPLLDLPTSRASILHCPVQKAAQGEKLAQDTRGEIHEGYVAFSE